MTTERTASGPSGPLPERHGKCRSEVDVEELNGATVALALAYCRERRGLLLPDIFALALSRTRPWAILSRDGSLRSGTQERCGMP